MAADVQDRVIAVVTRELDVPSGTITATTKSDDVEEWDSLGHLRVCMALEAEFGIEVELDEIENLDSVPALVALLD